MLVSAVQKTCAMIRDLGWEVFRGKASKVLRS